MSEDLNYIFEYLTNGISMNQLTQSANVDFKFLKNAIAFYIGVGMKIWLML